MFRLQDITLICISFVSFTLISQTAKDSTFKPKYYFYAGGFVPEIRTEIRFDSKTAHLGTVLSLENNLNFDSQPRLFRADGIAKFSKRSTAALSFIAINRSRTFTIDKDIEFKDTVFEVGAKANMYFNTNYWALSYRYSIFSKPTWNAGISTGFRALTIKTGISAESTRLGSYSADSKLLAPALLIGFHGSAYLLNRLQFRYTWEYLKLNINGIKVTVIDNNFGLEYYILRNVGIGGSYSYVSYKVREIPFNPEFSGMIEYTIFGFYLYVAVRF